MKNKYIQIMLAIIVFGSIISLTSYILYDTVSVIDTRVETIGGTIYECVNAHSYDNGMTYIDKPYYVEIPTSEIKIIKRIK